MTTPALGDGTVIGGAYAKGILRVPMVRIVAGKRTVVMVPVYVEAPVFGAAIKLNPQEHDIQEAAEVTNLNFHCGSKQPPVVLVSDLPGPMSV